MSILIVRHGETDLNRTRVVQPADTPLSELGQRQAARLAERLHGDGVAAILVSDLPRARMTAAPIEALTGVSAEATPLLQERNFGDLRGTPYDELTVDLFGPEFAPPGGETWAVFFARVAQAWAHIQARASRTDGNLVVVTHGLVCRALAGAHLGWPDGLAVPDYWHNTGVTQVERELPHTVLRHNCIAHLVDSERATATVSGL